MTEPITENRIRALFIEFKKEISHEIDRAVKPVAETANRNSKFLFGNGEPGWDEKLRVIYEYVQDRKAEDKHREGERRGTQTYLVRTIYGVAITTLVMLLINGFLWFIKIQPVLEELVNK